MNMFSDLLESRLVNYYLSPPFEKEKQMANTTVETGKFIIGSINKVNGYFSVSAKPYAHSNRASACSEAERLCKEDGTKKFVILEVKGIVSATKVVWE